MSADANVPYGLTESEEWCAADQGLPGMHALLCRAGIDAWIQNTGGHCMCIRVDAPDTDDRTEFLYITNNAEWHSGPSGPAGTYMVGHYYYIDPDGREYEDEGRIVAETMTETQVVAWVGLWCVGRHCPRCRVRLFPTVDDNSDTVRFRCEPCNVEECPDCGHWTVYDDAPDWGWWRHLDPATPPCFMHQSDDGTGR